ncbi:hypothetical protein AFEL58S_02049 [Afipia felis]
MKDDNTKQTNKPVGKPTNKPQSPAPAPGTQQFTREELLAIGLDPTPYGYPVKK